MTRPLGHRPTTLNGGPLHGHTARIYRNHGGHEPPTITLCLGLNLPHYEPRGYTTYQRQPNGDYTWTGTPMTSNEPDDYTHAMHQLTNAYNQATDQAEQSDDGSILTTDNSQPTKIANQSP